MTVCVNEVLGGQNFDSTEKGAIQEYGLNYSTLVGKSVLDIQVGQVKVDNNRCFLFYVKTRIGLIVVESQDVSVQLFLTTTTQVLNSAFNNSRYLTPTVQHKLNEDQKFHQHLSSMTHRCNS